MILVVTAHASEPRESLHGHSNYHLEYLLYDYFSIDFIQKIIYLLLKPYIHLRPLSELHVENKPNHPVKYR